MIFFGDFNVKQGETFFAKACGFAQNSGTSLQKEQLEGQKKLTGGGEIFRS